MKKIFTGICFLSIFLFIQFTSCRIGNTGISSGSSEIIDQKSIDIDEISENSIVNAKDTLHIAYGHTSHGSQLITGMYVLDTFMGGNGLYTYNNDGSGGALDLRDGIMVGDAGYYPQWVNETRFYLGDPDPVTGTGTDHPEINVVIWSWCGQVSSLTEERMISEYLSPMNQLEDDYPGVTFVYMTGHLDGTGLEGNLHQRNEQIRNYCLNNNKWLYDFANIESYDPDGNYYGDKYPNDNCDYDSDGNGSLDANWAINWQDSHTEGVDWYDCSSAHSQALNANMKAYAAWWLWARIAGWEGK